MRIESIPPFFDKAYLTNLKIEGHYGPAISYGPYGPYDMVDKHMDSMHDIRDPFKLIFYFSELIKVEKSNLRNDYGAYISKLVNSSNSDQGSTGLDKNVLTDHMSRVNLERDQVKALYKKGMKEKSRNNLWFLIILSPVN